MQIQFSPVISKPSGHTRKNSPGWEQLPVTIVPRFSGIESLKEHIAYLEFAERLKASGDDLVGPRDTKLFNQEVPIEKLIPHLDQFADEARRPENPLTEKTIELDGRRIQIAKIGQGYSGFVFKLTDGKESYALKVYRQRYLNGTNYTQYNSHAEFVVGLLLRNYQIRDCVRFQFGHASHWGIFEWIDPDMKAKDRPGEKLDDVLARYKLILVDRKQNNFSPGGIYYDLGGIVPDNFITRLLTSPLVYPLMRLRYRLLVMRMEREAAAKAKEQGSIKP